MQLPQQWNYIGIGIGSGSRNSHVENHLPRRVPLCWTAGCIRRCCAVLLVIASLRLGSRVSEVISEAIGGVISSGISGGGGMSTRIR